MQSIQREENAEMRNEICGESSDIEPGAKTETRAGVGEQASGNGGIYPRKYRNVYKPALKKVIRRGEVV